MQPTVVELLDDAVQQLAGVLSFDTLHDGRVVAISGLEDPKVLPLVGLHIAGQIANAVQSDLKIVQDFLPQTSKHWRFIDRTVDSLLGTDGVADQQFIRTRRNPWLAEALAHVLIHLSVHGIYLGLPGRVWAVTPVTFNVTRSGLDMVALFDDGDAPGYYVAEIKASEKNIASHFDSACNLFDEILEGKRSHELRIHVQSLAPFIPSEHRPALGAMVWSTNPVLAPILSHAASFSLNFASRDQSLRKRFDLPIQRVVIKIVPISSYAEFFDNMTNAVRQAISVLRSINDV